MSLTSCVLPSLRRRTSCSKSFNIAIIQATGSDSCLAFLCSDTTSCSARGTLPLCLEATSFSPTGSEAAGGILAPLLFLGLEGMPCEGIVSPFSLPSPQRSRQNVRVPFSLAQWPKDPRPNNCGLVDWAWFTAAKELFKNQVVHRASFLQYK